MRWDRLFAELEAQAADAQWEERDALVAELVDGDWAETSWLQMVSGQVTVHVVGVGRVEGRVLLANAAVLRLQAPAGEIVVSSSAVLEIIAAEGRGDDPGPVAGRLGWSHVLRALAAEAEPVRVYRLDGSVLDGTVEVVGRDFGRIRDEAGRPHVVPFQAIAVLRSR